MADETHDTPPLSEARLEQIRARHFDSHPLRGPNGTISIDHRFIGLYIQDHEILIAEVDRLRAREAAAMEIVRAVANGATTYRDREDEYCTQDPNCMWGRPRTGEPMQMVHTNRCIATKACALLAAETSE